MIAVILAAGIASRLRPLTNTTPKCLLKIGERCLLERSIDALLSCNIDEFVIVTGYRASQIEDFVKSKYPNTNVTFIFNERYETTNNIYSLWLTKDICMGRDMLLLDSDIVYDPLVVKAVLDNTSTSTLALNNHNLGEEEIKVITNEQGFVKEISKTCSIEKAIGESIGIEKLSSQYTTALFPILNKMILEEGQDNVFYEKAFERLIQQGEMFTVTDTTGLFSIELDTVDDFKQAQELIPSNLY